MSSSESSDSEVDQPQQREYSIREIQARRKNAKFVTHDKKVAETNAQWEQNQNDDETSTANAVSSHQAEEGEEDEYKPIHQRKKSKKPAELSNRFPNAGTRKAVKNRTVEVRDPRFSDMHGTFDADGFADAYGFIDQMRQKEKKELQKTIAKGKKLSGKKNKWARSAQYDAEHADQMLNKINSIDVARQRKQDLSDAMRKLKKEERDVAAERPGKKKFYIKQSAAKRVVLEEKFKKLEKDGQVDQAMAKLSKRQATKDRKFMPRSRVETPGY